MNNCSRDQIVVTKSKIFIDDSFFPIILHFPSTSPVFYSPSPECCGNTAGRGDDGARARETGPAHNHASPQPSLQGEGAAQP